MEKDNLIRVFPNAIPDELCDRLLRDTRKILIRTNKDIVIVV